MRIVRTAVAGAAITVVRGFKKVANHQMAAGFEYLLQQIE